MANVKTLWKHTPNHNTVIGITQQLREIPNSSKPRTPRPGQPWWLPGQRLPKEGEIWCLLEIQRENPWNNNSRKRLLCREQVSRVWSSLMSCTAVDGPALRWPCPAGWPTPLEGEAQNHGGGCYSEPVTHLQGGWGQQGTHSTQHSPTTGATSKQTVECLALRKGLACLKA